jgi:hypothetical protein
MPGGGASGVALLPYCTGNYIGPARLELPSVRGEKPDSPSLRRGRSACFVLAAAGLFAAALVLTSPAQAVSLQWHTQVTDADLSIRGGPYDLLPTSMAAGFYNGDNRSDIAVCSVANDTCWLWFGNPATSGGLKMDQPDIVFVGPLGGFGASVSFLGDLNGDGLGELGIGAPASVGEGGVLQGGSLWIFYGRANFTGEVGYYDANVTVFGAEGGDNLGFASAAAGDLDTDGFADFWVSAPNASEAGARVGEVLLFRGGAALPTSLYRSSAAARFIGTVATGEFGRVLLPATDLNGDGVLDLVTSTTRYRDGSNTAVGAAFAFLGPFILDGRTTNATRATMTFWGNVQTPSLGASLAFAPGFTKEGGRILMVGAPVYTNNTSTGGSLVLFKITPTACCQQFQTWDAVGLLYTIEPSDQMGISAAAGGDIDHDGHPDLIGGAPAANIKEPGGPNAPVRADGGRVFIVYGNASDRQPLLLDELQEGFEGKANRSYLGNIVCMGDVNGDGWADLIMSAQGDNGTYPASGSVYVFLGRPRNRPPQVRLNVTAGFNQTSNFTEGQEIFVRAELIDPDYDRMTTTWTGFENGITQYNKIVVTLNFNDEGGVTLTVVVFDGTLYNFTTVTIRALNGPPICDIRPLGPVVEGSRAVFALNVSDPGRLDQWTATWFGPGGFYPNGVSALFEPTRGGTAFINVTVADEDGGASICTLAQPIDNVAPTVSIRGPLILYEGDTGLYTAEINDPGSTDAFAFNWSTPDGVSQLNWTKFAALEVGRSRIELWVDDLDGGTTVATVWVEVKGTKPDVALLAPDTASEGDDLVFEVRQYSGFGYDPLTIAWNVCIPGQVDGQYYHVPAAEGGFFCVEAVVFDDEFDSVSINRTISVTNREPLSGVVATPNAPYNEGVSVTVRATVGDWETTLVDLIRFNWTVDGDRVSVAQSFTFKPTAGNHRVEVTATDGAGGVSHFALTIRVENVPPVVAISGRDTLLPGAIGIWKASAVDASGKPVDLVWDVDGVQVAHGAELAWSTQAQGSHVIRVTATDGAGGVSVASMIVSVSPPPPTNAGIDIRWLAVPLGAAAAFAAGILLGAYVIGRIRGQRRPKE